MGMMKDLDTLFGDTNTVTVEEEMNNIDTQDCEAQEQMAEAAAEFTQPTEAVAEFTQPSVVDEVFATALSTESSEEVDLDSPAPVNYTFQGSRYQLLCEGVCVSCAHCGQPLTDADSVQRGIGPICSKKGYDDIVEPKDDTEAFMALAEFPVLVEYLTKKFKAKGNRALVNGLTRVASLNRRTPVHAACTDAIEALGYKRLASALRESICTVELYDLPDNDKAYGFWIKKVDFSWAFWGKLRNLPGVHMVRFPKKQTIVPKEHRRSLAKFLVEHYEGLFLKTPKGTFKITQNWFNAVS